MDVKIHNHLGYYMSGHFSLSIPQYLFQQHSKLEPLHYEERNTQINHFSISIPFPIVFVEVQSKTLGFPGGASGEEPACQ